MNLGAAAVRAYSSLSVKLKLLAFFTFMTLVGLSTAYAALHYAYSVYDRQLYETSAVALNLSSAGAETELRKLQRLSFIVLSDNEIQRILNGLRNRSPDYEEFQSRSRLRQMLTRYFNAEPYVLSVHLLDSLERESSVGRSVVGIPSDKWQRIRDDTHDAGGRIRWFFADGGDKALLLAREIRAYDNLSLHPLGTLVIRIDMEKLIADVGSGLTSGGGSLLVMSGNERVYPAEAAVDPSGAASKRTERTGYLTLEKDGASYFVSYLRSAQTKWTYYHVIPFEGIFERIALLKRLIAALYAVGFAAAVAACFAFSRGITRPIETLTNRMRTLHKDGLDRIDPDALAPVSASLDEIGLLHRSFRSMMLRMQELIRENYVKQLKLQETELKALQAQMNPHFLYNTLETINWMAEMEGQKSISRLVLSLGFLLRKSVGLKSPLIPLREEMDIVRHYVVIQQARFGDQFRIEFDVPDDLLSHPVPKLSVQPVVENAFSHALEQMMEPCFIAVSARAADGRLEIAVADNGPGTDPDLLAKLYSGEVEPRGSGIGLRNIDERMKLLFGDEAGLSIDTAPGAGARVTLAVPLKKGGIGRDV